MNCPACQHELSPAATFCPACRERSRTEAGKAEVKVRAVAPGVSADNDPRERFFLIIACLFSAGALAIPRLYRSRAFGPVGKIVLGTIAALQTAAAVGIVLLIFFKWRELWAWWSDFLMDRMSHTHR